MCVQKRELIDCHWAEWCFYDFDANDDIYNSKQKVTAVGSAETVTMQQFTLKSRHLGGEVHPLQSELQFQGGWALHQDYVEPLEARGLCPSVLQWVHPCWHCAAQHQWPSWNLLYRDQQHWRRDKLEAALCCARIWRWGIWSGLCCWSDESIS